MGSVRIRVRSVAVPTRSKKRLGAFLHEVREKAGKTTIDAAEELKQDSPSTMNRYEAGEVLANWGTVRTLLDYYDASADDRERITRLWEEARLEPRSVRLPAALPKAFRKLVNAEQREAVRERELAPSVIPGLLQTEGYAQALIEGAHRFYDPTTRRKDLIAARMKRQKPLTGSDPLQFYALIDEAAIRRVIGGPGVHREQLTHVLSAVRRPNITVQVIPFEVGAYSAMNGSCVIIDYPEPDAISNVYLEYPTGGAWVENAEDVSRFDAMFDDVAGLALSPADSAELIHEQVKARASQVGS